MLVRIVPMCSLIAPCLLKQVPAIQAEIGAAPGCGFVDDALRAPAGLPWTTLHVDHRAGLRPQAPQPPTTTCEPEPTDTRSNEATTIVARGASEAHATRYRSARKPSLSHLRRSEFVRRCSRRHGRGALLVQGS